MSRPESASSTGAVRMIASRTPLPATSRAAASQATQTLASKPSPWPPSTRRRSRRRGRRSSRRRTATRAPSASARARRSPRRDCAVAVSRLARIRFLASSVQRWLIGSPTRLTTPSTASKASAGGRSSVGSQANQRDRRVGPLAPSSGSRVSPTTSSPRASSASQTAAPDRSACARDQNPHCDAFSRHRQRPSRRCRSRRRSARSRRGLGLLRRRPRRPSERRRG